MKITINENENYEINIPNEIEGKEFLNLTEKLIRLSKLILINSNNLSENKNTPQNKYENPLKRKIYNSRRKYFGDRNCVLDILQYYYHGSFKDKIRIMKLCNFESQMKFGKRMSSLKTRHNIKPSEIGFVSFRTPLNRNGIIEEDWVIKSYTGIFDEKKKKKKNGTDNGN